MKGGLRKSNRPHIAQTLRDKENAKKRHQSYPSCQMYDQMVSILNNKFNSKATKKKLLDLAKQLCNGTCLKIDRMAKRRKEALICWFCENFTCFLDNLSLFEIEEHDPKTDFMQVFHHDVDIHLFDDDETYEFQFFNFS